MRIPTQRIHNILTLCLAFSLPLDRQIPPLIIILLLLNWLVEGNWKEKISNYKTNKASLLPCLLYIWYGIGMLYTKNIEFGMKDLEMKLSLLVMPIIFASKPWLKKEDIHKIMNYFIMGCSFAAIICFAHSSLLYFNEIQQVKNGMLKDTYTNLNFFFSNNLSYFIHPSYFAMYLNLCSAYILHLFFSDEKTNFIRNRLTLSAILFAFSTTTAFLASKMGIIILLLLLICFVIYMIFKKKYYLTGVITVLLLACSSLFFFKNSEILASRFNFTLNTLESKQLDKTSSESNTVRILIWNQALNLIRENIIFGVGTGDIKNALLEKYKNEGMTGALNHRLNAHNQFFQTTIALGIPGFILIVATMLIPLFNKRVRNPVFIGFIVIIILNFSVESMLEIQAGTIFFSFFYSTLFLLNPEN